jgi:hypothetical protein
MTLQLGKTPSPPLPDTYTFDSKILPLPSDSRAIITYKKQCHTWKASEDEQHVKSCLGTSRDHICGSKHISSIIWECVHYGYIKANDIIKCVETAFFGVYGASYKKMSESTSDPLL